MEEIKIIGSVSNEEFFKLSTKALTSILSTDLLKRYKAISLLMCDNEIAFLKLILDDAKITISISKNKIRFRFSIYWYHDNFDLDYYVYKAGDPHYDIINKFKKDMVKNLRQFSKFNNIYWESSPIPNIKFYLYRKTLTYKQNFKKREMLLIIDSKLLCYKRLLLNLEPKYF